LSFLGSARAPACTVRRPRRTDEGRRRHRGSSVRSSVSAARRRKLHARRVRSPALPLPS